MKNNSVLTILSMSLLTIFPFMLSSFSVGAYPDITGQRAWFFVDNNPELERWGMKAAYDSARSVTVIFGGRNRAISYNDTWEFNGSTWHQVITNHSPVPRYEYGMVYDEKRHVTVLFGGRISESGRTNDLWEYDGNDWTQVIPEHTPLERQSLGMVYDSCREKVVLFGGYHNTLSLNDTWEYDGSDWKEIKPTASPSGRSEPNLAFDSQRCVTVLFGGDAISTALNDTWEYNGQTWVKIPTINAPEERWNSSIAYHPVIGRTVLFGGWGPQWPDGGTDYADTWEYDGSNWVKLNLRVSPQRRQENALVYESSSQKILLFGGIFLGDTWRYGSIYNTYLPQAHK